MNTQEAFSISISSIDWGLSSTSYSTDHPNAVFYYSFRNDGDARNRFYVTGIVADPNGYTTQMTPRIIKLNPSEIRMDKLTWNPASGTFPDGQYSAKIIIWQSEHDYEENKNLLFTDRIVFVIKKPLPPTPILSYHSTFLSLQVQDGTGQGYIKVLPTLTYGSSKLSTSDVSIYVDGNYKTEVTSNMLSSNIYTGSGYHTIKASVGEIPNTFDNSIRYRASSDTENYFVKAASIVGSGSSVTSSSGSGSSVTSSESFPIEYVVVPVAIAAVVGVGITLSRRRKATPVILVSTAKVQAVQTQDDTQFWVCPHCGGDTQYRNGKQFCGSCSRYL